MNLEQIRSENLSKELAYLLGVYITDGSISNNGWKGYSFQLKAIDSDFVEFTLSCIKKIKPDCNASVFKQRARDRKWMSGRRSKCNDQYCINTGFTDLGKFFKNQTNNKHHIPYLIWDASLPIKKWFIAGVMDGDGWISRTLRKDYVKNGLSGKYGLYQYRIGVGGVDEGWIYEFKNLLEKMGVKTLGTEIVTRDKDGERKPMARFGINIMSFVEHGLFFTISRKQERVKLLRNVQRLDVASPTGLR